MAKKGNPESVILPGGRGFHRMVPTANGERPARLLEITENVGRVWYEQFGNDWLKETGKEGSVSYNDLSSEEKTNFVGWVLLNKMTPEERYRLVEGRN